VVVEGNQAQLESPRWYTTDETISDIVVARAILAVPASSLNVQYAIN